LLELLVVGLETMVERAGGGGCDADEALGFWGTVYMLVFFPALPDPTPGYSWALKFGVSRGGSGGPDAWAPSVGPFHLHEMEPRQATRTRAG
jgi:hypothetical protein